MAAGRGVQRWDVARATGRWARPGVGWRRAIWTTCAACTMLRDAAERRELIVEGLNTAGSDSTRWASWTRSSTSSSGRSVLEGQFDERYLELPERVPITAMQSHQRYFPIVRDGRLDARFAFVANGGDAAVVAAGTRRCSWAGWRTPSSRTTGPGPRHRRDAGRAAPRQLPGGGGSLADKSEAVREISRQLCDRVEVEPPLREAVARAAELCKADLVSIWWPSSPTCRGTPGRCTPRDAGEPSEVCDAIADHHLPIEAGGGCRADEGAALLVGIRQGRHGRPWRSRWAHSRPAAAIPTACGGPRPASSRSRSSAATSWVWST